jgi:hypothetical protein
MFQTGGGGGSALSGADPLVAFVALVLLAAVTWWLFNR